MKILVLNAGSSSQKTCLYEIGSSIPEDAPTPLWEGKIEVDGDSAEVRERNSRGVRAEETVRVEAGSASVGELLVKLWSEKGRSFGARAAVDVVAHRIVNGGPDYRDPIFITPGVKAAIARASSFAPLHNAS